MPASTGSRVAILIALTLLVVATRSHHFAAIPDASWAAFFAAGFYLRGQTRWAFPWLMAVAVVVDVLVTRASGIGFWNSYCVSPGYAFLLPAYFSLWAGGAWLQTAQRRGGSLGRQLGRLLLALSASVAVCHALAQGGFYWLSDVVAAPTVAGWLANYGHWLLPYLQTTLLYVGPLAALHLLAAALSTRLGGRRSGPVGAG
jgi:hypothetical protein